MASTAVSTRPQRGAIYARYSTDDQNSVEDQIRECKTWAAANNVVIDDKMIFIDRGKTGRKTNRPGYQAMLDQLDDVDVVIVLETSRLHRKLYAVLKFIAEEIVDPEKRIVFVSQGIDTAKDDRYKTLLPILGLVDELRVMSGNANIQAAHKSMHAEGLAWGSRTFGYRGEAIEGRKTKKGKERRRWVSDKVEAQWVQKIFTWFVKDGVPIAQIVERLNNQSAPLPPKCSSGRWQRDAVKLVLSNSRYRGVWPYGVMQNIWQNKAEYNRHVERDEPLEVRIDEDLRIIDDELWFAAQKQSEVERERQAHRRRRGSGERLDGRARRGTLERQSLVPTTSEDPSVVAAVMAAYDAGKLYQAIADELEIDRNTVTKIVKNWHAEQDKPIPDGRTRRKTLENKSRHQDTRDS